MGNTKKTFDGNYKHRGYRIEKVGERYKVFNPSGEFVFSGNHLQKIGLEINKLIEKGKEVKV